MKKSITIIDTFGFFFRSFYALPPLTNSEGFPTGLLTGFANFLHTFTNEHSGDYILFALDAKGKTFRHEIDENYKANRSEAPQELKEQLPIAIEWIEKMGLKSISMSGYEADDIIATAARVAKNMDLDVRIVSHDKDLYQLIEDGKVVVVDAIKRKDTDEAACKEKYGIEASQFIDYQAILGDSADNVPGVKGVGKVGAAKLLNAYGDLDNIYKNINEIMPKGVRAKMAADKEAAYRSKELVSLKNDLFDSLELEELTIPTENPLLKIVDELHSYGLNRMLSRLKHEIANMKVAPEVVEKVKDESKEISAVLLDNSKKLFEVIDAIPNDTIVAIDTETTGLNVYKDTLVGFSFATDEKSGYYVPLTHNYLGVGEQVSLSDAKIALNKLLEKKIVGHNLKYDFAILGRFLEREMPQAYADTMVLAWLCDSSRAVGLDKSAEFYLQHIMISFKDVVAKGADFSSVELEDAAKYAAEDATITLQLFHKLTSVLKAQDAEYLLNEAQTIEYPFVSTLLQMESNGILIDQDFFTSLKISTKAEIDNITKTIHDLAGGEFNINSTKQLGVVLFETLGLQAIKKTKTGYSTDEKVLHALEDEHEIIPKLLEYRELFKLYSTYIDPLLNLSQESSDGRIHTSFVQTGTATGRLSSKNPNLQNIPVRTELGRQIRYGFVAPEGKKLISIDYSQIELRLLAHFSKDEVLLNAFNKDKDIHHETAVQLFGEDEAKEKRGIAKTVNFGLLYGMGSKKLSDTLGITTKEAKEIIEKYFKSFPTVKDYFASIEEEAQKFGHVETLFGRRRYFDFENARPMQLAAFKREAVNTVFQGSAADLIKKAMNKIAEEIKSKQLRCTMLLQIHDELLFEANEEDAQEFANRFTKAMETIEELNIPLKCSVNIGSSWGELK